MIFNRFFKSVITFVLFSFDAEIHAHYTQFNGIFSHRKSFFSFLCVGNAFTRFCISKNNKLFALILQHYRGFSQLIVFVFLLPDFCISYLQIRNIAFGNAGTSHTFILSAFLIENVTITYLQCHLHQLLSPRMSIVLIHSIVSTLSFQNAMQTMFFFNFCCSAVCFI